MAHCDAVVVGVNTVRQDNPLLTSHGVSSHNPLRVVMSRTLELPEEAQLWQTDEVPTVVFTAKGRQPWRQKTLQEQGVEVIEVETLTPAAVMANLHERGFLSVLWECGGKLSAQAIADGSVQKVLAFIAPKLIGGNMAPGPVGDLGLTRMDEAIALERLSLCSIGPDYLVSGYITRSQSS